MKVEFYTFRHLAAQRKEETGPGFPSSGFLKEEGKENIWNLIAFSQDLSNPTALDQEHNKFFAHLGVLAREKISRKGTNGIYGNKRGFRLG